MGGGGSEPKKKEAQALPAQGPTTPSFGPVRFSTV